MNTAALWDWCWSPSCRIETVFVALELVLSTDHLIVKSMCTDWCWHVPIKSQNPLFPYHFMSDVKSDRTADWSVQWAGLKSFHSPTPAIYILGNARQSELSAEEGCSLISTYLNPQQPEISQNFSASLSIFQFSKAPGERRWEVPVWLICWGISLFLLPFFCLLIKPGLSSGSVKVSLCPCTYNL